MIGGIDVASGSSGSSDGVVWWSLLLSMFPSWKVMLSVVVGSILAFGLVMGGWSKKYSKPRNELRKSGFAKIELLSEGNRGDEYGDRSRIPEIGRRFSQRLSNFGRLSSAFQLVAGDIDFDKFNEIGDDGDGDDEKKEEKRVGGNRRESVRVKGDVAVRYTKDGKKFQMYSKKGPATDMTLRELVGTKTTKMEIEEDVLKRVNWDEQIKKCVPVVVSNNKDDEDDGEEEKEDDDNDDRTQHKFPRHIHGPYTFCYRDYVNHEELMGMMWTRGGIEAFLFQPSRADILTIDEQSRCTLFAQSKLFWLIPILITWKGHLTWTTITAEKTMTTTKESSSSSSSSSLKIDWTSTALQLGWDMFWFTYKIFDKPAVAEKLAEKLRKDPWHILIPPTHDEKNNNDDDCGGDILCLNRENKGHLIFARERCLKSEELSSTSSSPGNIATTTTGDADTIDCYHTKTE